MVAHMSGDGSSKIGHVYTGQGRTAPVLPGEGRLSGELRAAARIASDCFSVPLR